MFFFFTAELTFPLVGLLDGAWVCVALETLQTLLLASGTGLWAPSVTAASSPGRFSAAVQGGNDKGQFRNEVSPTERSYFAVQLRTSPPMENEPSSRLWMMRLSTCRVMGEGSESVELSREPVSWSKIHSNQWHSTLSPIRPRFKIFYVVMETCSTA